MKQYESSLILNKLIDYRQSYFSHPWGDQFYSVVWNVDTAQGFGLDAWGNIVVIGRYLQIPLQTSYFGFNAAPSQGWAPFNQGTFYNGPQETQTYRLEDNAYRVLILAKAMANISATDSKSLNRVLNNLFPGRGRAYVNDLGSMSMRITFEYLLETWEKSVIAYSGAMPKPAGVQLTVVEVPRNDVFGFAEQGAGVAPFNNGTFFSESAVIHAN